MNSKQRAIYVTLPAAIACEFTDELVERCGCHVDDVSRVDESGNITLLLRGLPEALCAAATQIRAALALTPA